jgi:pyocin large subunit-like protein
MSHKIVVLWLLSALLLFAAGPGFRTRRQFEEHFQKHGAEFGAITSQEYLRLAQSLRDAPVGDSILQAKRADGVISKFDKGHGYFGAYDADGTIRTFFIPNDGERYFRRQARR